MNSLVHYNNLPMASASDRTAAVWLFTKPYFVLMQGCKLTRSSIDS